MMSVTPSAGSFSSPRRPSSNPLAPLPSSMRHRRVVPRKRSQTLFQSLRNWSLLSPNCSGRLQKNWMVISPFRRVMAHQRNRLGRTYAQGQMDLPTCKRHDGDQGVDDCRDFVERRDGDRSLRQSEARLPTAVAACEPVLRPEKDEDRLLQGCEPARLLRQHPLR